MESMSSIWTIKKHSIQSHISLLQKLQLFGFGGDLLRWIESFLTGRTMRVVVNGSSSSWMRVLSGVPQGSVLGPLFFLLYVNDLPDWIKTNIRIFADDTKIWTRITSVKDSECLQRDFGLTQSLVRKVALAP